MNAKKTFTGLSLLSVALLYSGCVPAPLAAADCSNLAGSYRASDFGFTSADGAFSEPFDGGALEVGFDAGFFDSGFSAPGYDPLGIVDAPYTAEAGALTFDKPFIDNVEPGVGTFECEVVDDNTFTLRNDDIGFDFDNDGVFEDGTFEGTFDAI